MRAAPTVVFLLLVGGDILRLERVDKWPWLERVGNGRGQREWIKVGWKSRESIAR